MAKLLRQKGRGRGEVRLDWGISSWLKAFVFPHPRHIKHLTTCRRLIDFTALLQTSCRSSAPPLRHTHTLRQSLSRLNPPTTSFPPVPVLGTVRFGCRPFCSCKLHSNYTILIRGTFKSFQFQVVPLFKCVALPLLPPFPRHPCAARFWFLLPKTSRWSCPQHKVCVRGERQQLGRHCKKLTYVRPEHFSGNSRATFFPVSVYFILFFFSHSFFPSLSLTLSLCLCRRLCAEFWVYLWHRGTCTWF